MDKYRKIKAGEIIKATDEYKSVFTSVYISVSECTIGQRLLDCNVKYYRRPISEKEVNT